uniref:VWFD domain-containing protein n=1 Tax=Erpetoichthys calabaricus TaxID=27687 RepID=A0A8C4T4Y2_ERPCA
MCQKTIFPFNVSARSPAQNNKVCSIWGNFHIKMYDGEVYQFPGTCNYVLTSHCGSNYEDFNIQIRKNVVNEQPKIIHVTMKLDGTVVTVRYRSYPILKFSTQVEMPEKYMNETCGLCGDFNGIENYGGFYANGESCYKISSLILPVFASCNALLSITSFVQACVIDMVDCGKNKTSSCLCHTVSEYSRQCANAGGHPQNWRTAEFCTKKCPQNLIHSECGSPCINTCSHPVQNQLCIKNCSDGCFCPPGMVLDDITKKGCIPLTKCSCTHNGQVTFICCCFTCSGGLWTCKDLDCPGTCAVEGGSHITSFDGTQFTFHGDCTYLLSKDHVDNRFAILSEIVKCGQSNTETCLKSVTLSLPTTNTCVVSFKEFLSSEHTFFSFLGNFTAFNPSTFHMIIDTTFGLQLQIQLSPLMQVYVTIDASYKSNTCGLCGNFNNVQTDDFNTASGVTEGTASAFANTWKTMATCPDVLDSYDDPCSQSFAKRWCSLLSDPSGPFSPCHSVIVSTSYEKNCMYDICTYEQSEDSMCAAVSSYVRACAAKGVFLTGWRSTICTNYSTSCPKTMTYSYRMTSCDHTCRSLSEPDFTCSVQFVPVDGCGCKQGTYMNQNGECVHESECPCYNKGSVLLAGEVVSRDGAISLCLKFTFFLTVVCKQPMTYLNCSTLPLGSPGAECQKSCQTLHMEWCVSGCVCPTGLVSNGHGKCILASQCPCIHNGITYKPGEKMKVGCNTCTCKDQKWQCTNLQCHGSCVIQGEGHHLTFDGKRFSFSGNCEYTVAQDYCGINSNNGTFRVITENIPCGSTGTTCSKAIKLFLGKDELRLSEGQYELMKRDVGVDMPYKIMHMGIYVVIETKTGLILMWDKKTSVHIKLSASFKGNVCGLCGNYDGNANNDFTTRSQSLVVNAMEFGNGWKVSPNCPDAKVPKDPCTSNPYRRSWALKQCSIIKSKVFAACHPQVDPTPYFDACVYDSCACDSGGDCECFCTSVAAYAAACNEANVCVSWRTPNLCPLFCDYYNGPDQCEWHYKPCGVPCMRTCRNPSGTCSSQIPGLEGCYPKCPPRKPFFDEDSMKCVARKDCGCYDKQDHHYQIGEKMPTSNVCQTCEQTTPGMSSKLTSSKETMPLYTSKQTTVPQSTNILSTTNNPTTQHETTSIAFISTSLPTAEVTSSPTTCRRQCQWSDWYDTHFPSLVKNDGDFETYQNIQQKGGNICANPAKIECRAEKFPNKTLQEVNQIVQCNVSVGLQCKNEDQDGEFPLCYNYQIRVLCCGIYYCETTVMQAENTTLLPSTPSGNEVSNPSGYPLSSTVSSTLEEIRTSNVTPSSKSTVVPFSTTNEKTHRSFTTSIVPTMSNTSISIGISSASSTTLRLSTVMSTALGTNIITSGTGTVKSTTKKTTRSQPTSEYVKELTETLPTLIIPSDSPTPFTVTDKSIVTLPLISDTSTESSPLTKSQGLSTKPELTTIISAITPVISTEHVSYSTSQLSESSSSQVPTRPLSKSTTQQTTVTTQMLDKSTGQVSKSTSQKTTEKTTSQKMTEKTTYLITTRPVSKINTLSSTELITKTSQKVTEATSSPKPTGDVSKTTSWKTTEKPISSLSTVPVSKTTSQTATGKITSSLFTGSVSKTTSQMTTEKTTSPLPTDLVSKTTFLRSTEKTTSLSTDLGSEKTTSSKITEYVSKTTSWKTSEKTAISLSIGPVSTTTSHSMTEKTTSPKLTSSVTGTTSLKSTERTVSPVPTETTYKTTSQKTEKTTSFSTGVVSKTTMQKTSDKMTSTKSTEPVSKTTSWKTTGKSAASSLFTEPVPKTTSQRITVMSTNSNTTGTVSQTASQKTTAKTMPTVPATKTTLQKTEKTTSLSTGMLSKTTSQKITDTKSTLPVSKTTPLKSTGNTTHSVSTGSISKSTSNTTTTKTTLCPPA